MEKELFIKDYRSRLETAVNIFNGYRLGKFELKSSTDKRNEFLSEIEFFKQQGRLN